MISEENKVFIFGEEGWSIWWIWPQDEAGGGGSSGGHVAARHLL